jgi:hypothetical protein
VRGNGLAVRPAPRPGPTSHLAGVCDTLVGDGDGVYHPALFNDRLVLGMKGIMSEAELHVLRAACKAVSGTKPPVASCAAACRSA